MILALKLMEMWKRTENCEWWILSNHWIIINEKVGQENLNLPFVWLQADGAERGGWDGAWRATSSPRRKCFCPKKIGSKKTGWLDIKRNLFICDVIFASLKVAEQKAGSCNERVTRSMAVNSPMLQFSPALTSMLRAVPSVLSPGQYSGR